MSNVRFNFVLSDEERSTLRAVAAETKTTESEVLRKCIALAGKVSLGELYVSDDGKTFNRVIWRY